MVTSKTKRMRKSRSKPQPGKKTETTKNRPQVKAVKDTTKTESVIVLLQRPEGATIKTMMKATGWQSHSVRGFLAGTAIKGRGLKLESEKADGERVYRIASDRKAGAASPSEKRIA